MSEYRKTTIHRSVVRPQLFAGAERQVALGIMLMSFLIGFAGYMAMNPVTLAAAVVIYVVLMGLARQMAKVDPDMAKIYQRHVQYRGLYSARSTPWRVDQ